MVWFWVMRPVFVCWRGSRLVISPFSVRWNVTVRVGVKVWYIWPAEVLALIVKVGVISRV